MYRSREAGEIAILLRISRELDICGEVTATIDNPSELLAWAAILTEHTISAGRTQGSGNRYLQVAAEHRRAPIRGHISAVLHCEDHRQLWTACGLDDLKAGDARSLLAADLASAWEAMPITPEDVATPPPSPSTGAAQESTKLNMLVAILLLATRCACQSANRTAAVNGTLGVLSAT